MSESILVALITGGISLIGTIITVLAANRKTATEIKVSQAIMEQNIAELTREVRIHNSYVTRVPVLEEKVANLERRNAG